MFSNSRDNTGCFYVCIKIQPSEINFKLVILTYLKRLKRRCYLSDIDNLSKKLFEIYKHCNTVDPRYICKYIFKLPQVN